MLQGAPEATRTGTTMTGGHGEGPEASLQTSDGSRPQSTCLSSFVHVSCLRTSQRQLADGGTHAAGGPRGYSTETTITGLRSKAAGVSADDWCQMMPHACAPHDSS